MAFGQWIRAGLEDSSKKSMILVLDGVRAIACLIVIWFHIYRIPLDLHLWNPSPFAHPLRDAFLNFGKHGVTLFFVLSGFLLFLPFARALLFAKTWPSIRQFYTKRVWRILPAYYLSLILIVLFLQRQYLQPQHWQELALFFTFFMDSSQATFKQLNAPFWTLAIEWQYYLLLPLLALSMRKVVLRVKQSYRLTAAVTCILVLIAWGLFTRYVGTYYVNEHPTATFLLPRSVLNVFLFFTYGVSGKYYEDFGVGMLLSLCFASVEHPSVSPKVRATLQKLSPWLWGTGLLCVFAMVLWEYNQLYPGTWPLFSQPLLVNDYYLIDEFCISLSFGLCILALLLGSTRLKRPLEGVSLRWIGMISYSLYMWHLPFLLMIMQWSQPLMVGWSPELSYAVYWLGIMMVVIPFCFLFFKYVEQPGMKLGERLRSARLNPPEPFTNADHDAA